MAHAVLPPAFTAGGLADPTLPERRINPVRHDLERALSAARCSWPRTRRLLDVSFSLCALVLIAPLIVVLIAAVKLSSPGPAFYGHVRVGYRGRAFRCWKLRTMVTDADERLRDLLAARPDLAEEFAEGYKLREDPRVTRLGGFLRRTSLDELPQFFNVLCGDMSVVGPRPIVWAEAPLYGDVLPRVLTVRPGLTGWWQVSGRNAVPYATRVALQVRSAGERSPLQDLVLIAKTLTTIWHPGRRDAF